MSGMIEAGRWERRPLTTWMWPFSLGSSPLFRSSSFIVPLTFCSGFIYFSLHAQHALASRPHSAGEKCDRCAGAASVDGTEGGNRLSSMQKDDGFITSNDKAFILKVRFISKELRTPDLQGGIHCGFTLHCSVPAGLAGGAPHRWEEAV